MNIINGIISYIWQLYMLKMMNIIMAMKMNSFQGLKNMFLIRLNRRKFIGSL